MSSTRKDFHLVVVPPPQPLVLSDPTELPTGVAQRPYSFQFHATGGVAPYTFRALNPMPPDTTLSPSGLLSGPLTTVSEYVLMLEVSDSESN